MRSNRSIWLAGVWLAVGCVVPCSALNSFAQQPASLAGSRPNIILVMTDDQGYGDLGRHGNPILKTPALDRMYDESVRLTDFHVSPTCAPTRCSIMTGRHEFKSGVTHTIQERERMSLKATTIVSLLKASGYRTGIFGKWHLGDEAPYQPEQRGFEEVFIHGAGGIGQTYPGSCGDAPKNDYFDPVILHNGIFEKTQGYCTDVFFRQALAWLDQQRQQSQPFLAYITPNAPHGPLICPAEAAAVYRDQVPEATAKFFGMISNIDANMGRLLEKLDDWQIAEKTLVIFMNDNGGTEGVKVWNAGMRGQKATPYNGGTRAIGLFRWKKKLVPGNAKQLTAHLDFFPTFAELAGIAIPATVSLDGFSLVPILQNAEAPWPYRFLFTHVGRWPNGEVEKAKFQQCGIRHGNFNLVHMKPDGAWQLFDLNADPAEKTDVRAQHPEVFQKMTAAYDRWWEEVIPLLDNEEAYKTAPKINSFHERYWKQYQGSGPNNAPPPVNQPLP